LLEYFVVCAMYIIETTSLHSALLKGHWSPSPRHGMLAVG